MEIDDVMLHALLFADDQIAQYEDDIPYTIRILSETFGKWGLKMDFNKTKDSSRRKDLDIDEETIQACRENKYLGVIVPKRINKKNTTTKTSSSKNEGTRVSSIFTYSVGKCNHKKRMTNDSLAITACSYQTITFHLLFGNQLN